MVRAKMKVQQVTTFESGAERVNFSAVCKPNGYPADGTDEDNTFALFTPSGSLELTISNPAIAGQFKAGQKYYIDMTLVVEPK